MLLMPLVRQLVDQGLHHVVIGAPGGHRALVLAAPSDGAQVLVIIEQPHFDDVPLRGEAVRASDHHLAWSPSEGLRGLAPGLGSI